MKKLLISTFLILFLISCGGKQTTQMKVSLGAVTGSTNFPGGLVIKGESLAGEKFSLKVPSNDKLIIEVPNGTWNFVALGWDGTEIFEGKSYCDVKTNVLLDGGDFNLNLLATTTNCNHPVFGNIADSNGSFLPLRFNSCMGIKKYIADGDYDEGIADEKCNGKNEGPLPGDALSVKISMLDFALGQQAQAGQLGLTSKCYNLSDAQIDTNIKLPYGSSNVVMPYVIQAYPAQNCAGAPEKFLFPKGLSLTPADNRAVAVLDNTNHRSVVFLHTDTCTGNMLTKTPFANGNPSTGTTRLICNKTHWEKINAEADNGESYQIGADINFGGSNTTIARTFKGSIHGMSYTLSNGDKPLFDSITSMGSNERTEIRNLNIDNFNIIVSSSGTTRNYGILANDVYSSAPDDTDGIGIGNNKITNSSITQTDTNAESAIGGMIGSVLFQADTPAVTPGSGEYLSIRENHVEVDISANSEDPDMSIGGIVGEIKAIQSSMGGVNLEYNLVGSEDDTTSPPTVNRVQLTAVQGAVGGIVGSVKNAEIRDGNVAYTSVEAGDACSEDSNCIAVGGLVGKTLDASTHISAISASFGDIEFTPAAYVENIGGVIGHVNDHTLKMYGTIGKLTMLKADSVIHAQKVGGLVGYANVTNSDTLKIRNAKGVLISNTNGRYYGGIFGRFSATELGSVFTITSSVAVVDIAPETISSSEEVIDGTNNYRGGIAGYAKKLAAEFMVANIINLEGHSKIGGAYGEASYSKLRESFLLASDIVANSESSAYVGGVVGNITYANEDDYKKLKVLIEVLEVPNINTTDCATTEFCGLLVGHQSQNSVNKVFNEAIVLGKMYDSGNPSSSPEDPITNVFCGSETTDNCADTGAEPALVNISTDDSTCSGMGGTFALNTAETPDVCEPIFLTKWKEYGFSDESGLPNFKAGSLAEPFLISNATDWNGIGDDIFLMSKTFKLTNNIDFKNGTFTPIGKSIGGNAYKGTIWPDGFKLQNINFTASSGLNGIFSRINTARIGFNGDPLVVDGFTFTTSEKYSGFIGQAMGRAEIMVQIKNANITGTSSDEGLGGILGKIENNSYIRIEDSSFEGSISAASTGHVGGLVGSVGSTSENSTSGIDIRSSFVKLKKLYGDYAVGGFIGSAGSNSNVSIEESYVWIDKAGNQNSDDDDIKATSEGGAMVGFVDSGTNLSVRQVYADLSNTKVSDNVSAFFGGSTSINLNDVDSSSVVYVGPKDIPNGSFSNGEDYETHSLMLDTVGDFETGDPGHDWAKDANGNLVLGWEIYGFNNY